MQLHTANIIKYKYIKESRTKIAYALTRIDDPKPVALGSLQWRYFKEAL